MIMRNTMGNEPEDSDWEPAWAELAQAGEPDSDRPAEGEPDVDAGEDEGDDGSGDGASDGLAAARPAPPLRTSLEAVLLVADEPVTEQQFAEVTGHPAAAVGTELRELSASYTAEQRGFDLREVAG